MAETKVAAVLGIGPALGAAVARRFARAGYAVALMARGTDQSEALVAEIEGSGGRALALAADATDPAQVAEALSAAADQLGPIELFVYNAGAFQMGGILEISPEDFERCWRANCFGAFLGAQQVLPAMLERGSGTILLTGATAALRGSARFSCLAVGKFGLRALAQSMAREFGPRGVHVAHIIIDGQIDTPAIQERAPDRETHTLLAPDAIAEAYLQLHRQDPTAWTLELDLRPAVERF